MTTTQAHHEVSHELFRWYYHEQAMRNNPIATEARRQTARDRIARLSPADRAECERLMKQFD